MPRISVDGTRRTRSPLLEIEPANSARSATENGAVGDDRCASPPLPRPWKPNPRGAEPPCYG